MIIITQTRLKKRQRSRIVKSLSNLPSGYRIWDANIHTIDEGITYRVPNRNYFTEGENAVLEHPIVNSRLYYDWLTNYQAISYKEDKCRDWGNEIIYPHSTRMSVRSAIYYICLTNVEFEFDGFEVDVPAGHSITIPADWLYKIVATGRKRYLLYRYFMVNRSKARHLLTQ